MSMEAEPSFTHRITLPSLNEIEFLFESSMKEFFFDFYCSLNPKKFGGYDLEFDMYMGFGLYIDHQLHLYFSNEMTDKVPGRVIVKTDPPVGFIQHLGRSRTEDTGIAFEFAFPPDFDINKFRQDLPDIVILPIESGSDILASWSDLLITKLTPERLSIEAMLPLAPRHKQGGMYVL